MTKRIVFFSNRKIDHQAGPIYRIGSDLAAAGKTVILVDANPQCNLTLHSLTKATKNDEAAIKEVLAFDHNIDIGVHLELKWVYCYKLNERLLLLPGSISFAESETLPNINKLLFSITNLLDTIAKQYNADYILIDTDTTLGKINQSIVTTSDFWVIPLSTYNNTFPTQALYSLIKVVTDWIDWTKIYKYKGENPFPGVRWLGMFPVDNTAITDDLAYVVKTCLLPELQERDMIPTLAQNWEIHEFMRAAKNNLGA